MSNYPSHPSVQEDTASQPNGNTQAIGTPSRSSAAKGRKPRNSRTQRHQQPKPQSSSVDNRVYSGLNPEALSVEQEVAHSGPGEDSQDSTPQHHSTRQRRRAPQKNAPNRPQDYKPSAIPPFDGTSSPGRAQPASQVTGSPAVQATPIKQAYAGPTFHASPAASSLPIPKFFARSGPASDAYQAQSTLEDDFSSRNSPAAEGLRGNSKYHSQRPPPPREESPLDMLFNAHRAEQARQKSEEALCSTDSMSRRLMTPESGEQARYASSSRPNSHSSAYNRSNGGKFAEKTMFMMELDGTGDSETSEDGQPPVPFKDRLGVARSTSSLSVTQTNDNNHEDDEMERQAKSQALKNLLMQQRTPNESYSQQESTAFQPVGAGTGPEYARRHEIADPPPQPHKGFDHGNASAATPAPSATDVRAMEDNLRRILKLNP